MDNPSSTAAGRAAEITRACIRLFFNPRGRLSRGRFWQATLLVWAMFWLTYMLLDGVSSFDLTRIPAVILLYSLDCLCSKRYHDLDRSAWWLLLLLIPLIGLVIVLFELGFKRGSVGENGFGSDPRTSQGARSRDYATVA